MPNWRQYWRQNWREILAVIVFLFFVDLAISSYWTCWTSFEQASQNTSHQHANEYCTAFHGPLLTAVRSILVLLNRYGTAIIALFTIVLALSTIALWRSNTEMGRLTEKIADIQERQKLIAGRQTDIQEKQHAIVRLQFLATHRPRLRIRHVSINDPDADIGLPKFRPSSEQEVRGGLVVVNSGGTKAKIIESRYCIYFSKVGLPVSAPYDTDFYRLLLPDQTLDAGESCATPIAAKITMKSSGIDAKVDAELSKFGTLPWHIYVMGQIRYQDEGGADRFMGFCRERDSDGRFRAVDDPDYEYED